MDKNFQNIFGLLSTYCSRLITLSRELVRKRHKGYRKLILKKFWMLTHGRYFCSLERKRDHFFVLNIQAVFLIFNA